MAALALAGLVTGCGDSSETTDTLAPVTSSETVASDTNSESGEGEGSVVEDIEPLLEDLATAMTQALVIEGACGDTSSADLVAAFEAAAGRAGTDDLLAAIDATAEVCGDPDQWRASFGSTLDEWLVLQENWASSDWAGANGRVELAGSLQPLGDGSFDDATLTVRAGLLSDRTHGLLTVRTPGGNTDLWYGGSEWDHLSHLRSPLGDQTPERIILGSSVAFNGMDAQLIEETTGQVTYNAGIEAAGQIPYLRDMLPVIDELVPGVGLVSAISSFEILNCQTFRDGIWNSVQEARAQAFSGVPHLAGGDPLMMLIGEPGDRPEGAISTSARMLIESAALTGSREMMAAIIRDSLGGVAESAPQPCEPLLEQMEAMAADAAATGRELTFVMMPVSPEGLAIHREFSEGHADATAAVAAIAETHKVGFLDLHEWGEQSDFMDDLHLNADGRIAISEMIASYLAGEA